MRHMLEKQKSSYFDFGCCRRKNKMNFVIEDDDEPSEIDDVEEEEKYSCN